jgi:hypothetical protein
MVPARGHDRVRHGLTNRQIVTGQSDDNLTWLAIRGSQVGTTTRALKHD